MTEYLVVEMMKIHGFWVSLERSALHFDSKRRAKKRAKELAEDIARLVPMNMQSKVAFEILEIKNETKRVIAEYSWKGKVCVKSL